MVKFASLLLALPAVYAFECRPEGRIVPAPRDLTKSKVFKDALANFTASLDGVFKGKVRVGWETKNVSLSMGLVHTGQDKPTKPLWEYHHLGSANVNGTKHLDRHSQYLVGSVSKVITDAILLRSGVDPDTPVTKYLTKLNASESIIDWNSITLRALGGQLSGIPANYGFSEYHYIKTYFEALGFPHINDTSYPPCGVIGLNTECTADQMLTGMLTAHPQSAPELRPVYSNIAYTFLALALEAATGKNYTVQLQDYLSTPLNMPSTFPSPGDDKLAVIPPVESTWGSPYGINAPGGGLVSTLADLSAFLHAILTRSPHLAEDPTDILAWLQPRTFSGSHSGAVGLPWEIFRPHPSLLFPHYDPVAETGGHTVSIYAKDGAAYGYHARIALLDEYGVGLVLLTAGDQDALGDVYDAALTVLVPALEQAAREQAEQQYTGSFRGVSSEETGGVVVNATTELDGTSLLLTGLWRNGSDIISGYRQLWDVTLSPFLPSMELTDKFRIYPTEMERKKTLGDGREVVEEDWRLWYVLDRESVSELPGKGLSNNDCLTWTLTDWLYYGNEPADRFVFTKDAKTGEVLAFDAPFLRSGAMDKVKVGEC
ncbi:beta-lactamase/transpeptidase-like protein [Dichotomopilus funicola]|uniref:Beta-lactamase/transpeptidase-like protein n=1 Tax=Dichotomopilus funicola TaxID=1934379 RepID=A0AAN6ZLC7_9PEZI|nr:beta-lactamase/transpeptidase-like protein [Dichotomopilus funicola]